MFSAGVLAPKKLRSQANVENITQASFVLSELLAQIARDVCPEEISTEVHISVWDNLLLSAVLFKN